ncbi:MAG: RNA-binding S4 domain-containing protein [Firmicutes bacterium]|nr:RNA-binding S4 domain-containing protein [Bacillota bacterium]
MKKVFIETECIKLDQLLKFSELVDSGGMAKILISEGYVKLNGKVCDQRGKKIFHDDLVEVTIPVDDSTKETHIIKVIKRG